MGASATAPAATYAAGMPAGTADRSVIINAGPTRIVAGEAVRGRPLAIMRERMKNKRISLPTWRLRNDSREGPSFPPRDRGRAFAPAAQLARRHQSGWPQVFALLLAAGALRSGLSSCDRAVSAVVVGLW